jgi:hypothetical protein
VLLEEEEEEEAEEEYLGRIPLVEVDGGDVQNAWSPLGVMGETGESNAGSGLAEVVCVRIGSTVAVGVGEEMLCWGVALSKNDGENVGLASLSVKGEEFWYLVFLRCRRRRSMKIPISASAAMAPTTTPAIRPGEGFESECSGDAAATFVDVEEADSCDDDPDAVPLVDEGLPVSVLTIELSSPPTALVAVIAAAILVGFAGVGNAFTTPPATLSITAVGTVTPLLDSTDETSPTMLDKRSPICLFWRKCSFPTLSASTLPAARQMSFVLRSVDARSVCAHGPEA